MATYDLDSLALKHHIEEADIASPSSPEGWLTTCAVVHILLEHDNRNRDRNLVDPSWWAAWQSEEYPNPGNQSPPDFFLPRIRPSDGSLTRVRALVAPLTMRNSHWVTLFIDLEENQVTLYDSRPLPARTEEVKFMIEIFFGMFRSMFKGGQELRFVEGKCTLQKDGNVCGIIACVNSCLLLDDRRPERNPFSEGGIAGDREFLTAGLRKRMVKYGAKAVFTPPLTPDVDGEAGKKGDDSLAGVESAASTNTRPENPGLFSWKARPSQHLVNAHHSRLAF